MGLGYLSTSLTANSITDEENQKLRKPLAEKLRRDRINSSIKKLRQILGKMFPKQHPSSKLEKADILELAVSFIKQQ
ncbi:transcription factor HES-5-like [Protopterus annectens]|uniref:transcription factor HES-5-like n=1 Tax=Protopterus annectens TaxID=7888 RepID=UPI001CFA31B1|nr:transcription factor HES-5-like [Protopterus annectens]